MKDVFRFIPSRDGGESILIKRQKRRRGERMNLIKDIRIFFPFVGSAQPPCPERARGKRQTRGREEGRTHTSEMRQ